MRRILVAGIGNIFLGDDAFGIETVRQLSQRASPNEVEVADFGIRSYDLAYAIAEGYDAVILVDATQREDCPGTVYLIEPDVEKLGSLETEAIDAHSINPVATLQMVQSLGGAIPRLYLVGCEPADLGGEEGRMGLSDEVAAAVPRAVEMILAQIGELLGEQGAVAGIAANERR